jgi:hypothetical protein
MALYFVYQMRGSTKRNVGVELVLAACSSFTLGFGSLFVMQSFGLYV